MTALKMRMSLNKIGLGRESVLFFIALVVYKILLSVIYINFMSVVVAYYGFSYEPSLLRSVLSWSVYLPLLLCVKSDFRKPSDFFLFVFLILIITPMLILMELGGKSAAFLSYSLVCFLVIGVIVRLPKLNFPRIRNGTKLALALALITTGSVFGMFFVTSGFASINFDLALVYALREETENIFFGGFWGYLTPWSTKVFLPFLFSIALFKKKYIIIVLLIFIQVLAFGITGHRSMAILPIFAVGIFLARNKTHKNLYILVLLTSLLLLIYMLHVYFQDVLISSTIFRRAIFLPSYLNYSYYQFFVENEYVYYSDSVLSQISDYPYGSESLSNLVITGANTGFLGTSYAHGGPLGMLIISSLVGMVLKVLDGTCENTQDVCFYVSYASFPILAMLTSAAFFTSLLTQGVLLVILMTWLYQFNPRAD